MLIKWRNNSFPAMSNVFDDFFNDSLTSLFGRDLSDVFERNPGMAMPAVNVKETGDAFQIEVAAPGLQKEDFNLNLERNILTISAQKESRAEYGPSNQTEGQGQENSQGAPTATADAQSTDQANASQQGESRSQGAMQSRPAAQSSAMQQRNQNQMERYTRREFSYTSFERSFSLPETTDPERISANYENGILTINVPKREQQQMRQSRTINIS